MNLLLIQASPLHEELERIAADLIPLVSDTTARNLVRSA